MSSKIEKPPAPRAEYKKEWRARNAEKQKKYHREYARRRRYKLSKEEFHNLTNAPPEKCPICRGTDPGPKGWCIDHDHSTGKVREVICGYCNSGLGYFKENRCSLDRAYEYLTKHRIKYLCS